VKLRQRLGKLIPEAQEAYQNAAGEPLRTTVDRLQHELLDVMVKWIKEKPGIGPILDWQPESGRAIPLPISEHPDKVVSVTPGYPDKLIRVRLNEKASPDFVELMLASRQARAWLRPRIKTAAGQHGISGKDLKQFPVPLPPAAQQNDIVQRARSVLIWTDRLAAETSYASKLIDHFDQAILVKAFWGKLVPQDQSDEPASVLLERIRAERQTATAPRGRQQHPKAGPAHRRTRGGH
jgi:hypothetical protein